MQKAKRMLLIGILCVIAILVAFPMIITFLSSFMSGGEVNDYMRPEIINKSIKLIPDEASLEQFGTILIRQNQFWDYFWNSVILTVPIVLGQIVVSIMAAYAFTMMKNKYKEWLFFAYIVVMLLPFQVTLVPAYLTINTLGLSNSRFAVILPGIFSSFGVFLLRQHMDQIPKGYFEAARMDDRGHFRTFFHVALPLCKTSIAALAILCFIDNWSMIEQPLVFLSDQSMWPLSLYFYEISQNAISVAFAASMVFMLPNIIVFMNGEKYLMEGIRLSGLK